ncbi:MAG: hypothetical protein QW331_01915 [Candidatus Woesearchaeota archaeon]
MSNEVKFLATGDFHGNEFVLDQIVELAIREKAGFVLFNGDLTPKKDVAITEDRKAFNDLFYDLDELEKFTPEKIKRYLAGRVCDSVSEALREGRFLVDLSKTGITLESLTTEKGARVLQRFAYGLNYGKPQTDFLKNRFIKYLERLKEARIKVVSILGNDDDADAAIVMRRLQEEGLLQYVNLSSIEIVEGIKIFGFNYCHKTDFGFYPHWEKPEAELFNLLTDFLKNQDLNKTTIGLFHDAPKDTHLDITLGKEHIGSAAIRKFITLPRESEYRDTSFFQNLLLTVHGNIHEAPYVSRRFMQTYRQLRTVSVNPGGEHKSVETLVREPRNPSEKYFADVVIINLRHVRGNQYRIDYMKHTKPQLFCKRVVKQ